MTRDKTIIKIALLAAIILASVPGAGNAATTENVIANVGVACPFNVTLNANTLYVRTGNILLNYTLSAQSTCTLQNVPGTFTLTYQSTGHQFVSENEIVNSIVSAKATYPIAPINSLALPAGNYIARIHFSQGPSSNSSSKLIDLLMPVNISLLDFSESPSSAGIGATVTFYATLKNIGDFASNSLSLFLIINGSSDHTFNFSASPLTPGQEENLTISLSNVTSSGGSYFATAYVNYTANGTTVRSNSRNASYFVSSAPQQQPGPPPKKQVAGFPTLSFTSFPLLISTQQNSSAISELGIANTGNNQEYVNMSFPSSYSKILSLSAYSLLLNPGSGVSVRVLFNPGAGSLGSGLYVIPINMTLSIVNGVATQRTEFLEFLVASPSPGKSLLLKQIISQNNTALITLQVIGPQNRDINNATVVASLPKIVAHSKNNITATGLPSTVNASNYDYTISSFLAHLPAGGAAYAYYSISNPINITALSQIQATLQEPAPSSPQGIIRVLNIKVPTFYNDSTAQIEVDALYTGTSSHAVAFSLTAPPSLAVQNPTQAVNATPNRLMIEYFNVTAGSQTGTNLVNLYITTAGSNLTYTIPLIVLQKIPTTTIPQQIPPNTYQINIGLLELEVGLSIFIIFLVGLILLRIRAGRPRYQKRRVEELVRIREQIKRSGDDEQNV